MTAPACRRFRQAGGVEAAGPGAVTETERAPIQWSCQESSGSTSSRQRTWRMASSPGRSGPATEAGSAAPQQPQLLQAGRVPPKGGGGQVGLLGGGKTSGNHSRHGLVLLSRRPPIFQKAGRLLSAWAGRRGIMRFHFQLPAGNAVGRNPCPRRGGPPAAGGKRKDPWEKAPGRLRDNRGIWYNHFLGRRSRKGSIHGGEPAWMCGQATVC